jgi:hypothetical protein
MEKSNIDPTTCPDCGEQKLVTEDMCVFCQENWHDDEDADDELIV